MDFSHLTTEQVNPESLKLDTLNTLDEVRLMNSMDAQVAGAVAQAAPQIAQAVDAIAERFQRGGRLIYCGAGTSGRLGVLDASECPPTFGVSPEQVVGLMAGGERAIRVPIEGAEDSPELGADDVSRVRVGENDVLVAISASGYAPYCVGAVEEARARGAFTAAVVCAKDSVLSRHVQVCIEAVVGPEIVSGSTRLRAGTATKMVLNMLTTLSMVRVGKVYGNLMVDMKPSNAKLRDRAVRIVMQALNCGRERAQELLGACDGNVKAAIVCGETGCGAQIAEKALDACQGFVRRAIAQVQDEK